MTFTHATAVKKRCNMESVEKLVNLVENTNISLQFILSEMFAKNQCRNWYFYLRLSKLPNHHNR